jgi:hypothetical protein
MDQARSARTNSSEYTSLHVHVDVRDQLQSLKPYDSMSFNDLLIDMAKQYDPRQPETDISR